MRGLKYSFPAIQTQLQIGRNEALMFLIECMNRLITSNLNTKILANTKQARDR